MEGIIGNRGVIAPLPNLRVFELTVPDVRLLVKAINDGDSLTLAEWGYVERLVGRLEGFAEEADREDGTITEDYGEM